MLPETRFLIQYLKTLQVGDIADYATMSEHAGASVLEKRYILSKAIDIVARDYQIILRNVSGVGYERVENSEVPESIAQKQTSKIRAACGKWRSTVNHSGESSTPAGLRSLDKCSYVEFSVDAETQKIIAANSRHQQAFDFKRKGKRLLELFEEDARSSS